MLPLLLKLRASNDIFAGPDMRVDDGDGLD